MTGPGRPGPTTVLVLLVVLVVVLPFSDKAFHIDDPLFLWAARQIHTAPADFYGFRVNWYGTEMAMAEVTKNPPLAAYYLAAAAAVGGWSERALHLAFGLPALLAVLGTHRLAARLCRHPGLATILAALTPAFVVSAGTVMSDVMMLAAWLWAVVLWLDGVDRDSGPRLAGAALLVGVAALAKYFAAALILLLGLYAVVRRGWRWRWPLALALPVIGLAGYQWFTQLTYGRGLLFDAASYATAVRFQSGPALVSKSLIGLAFTGGCLAGVALAALAVWPARAPAAALLLVPALGLVALSLDSIGGQALVADGQVRWALVVQLAGLAAGGVAVLALAVADGWRRRDAPAVLLLAWVLGTFVFATFLNWSVNARSILPLAPAAAVLAVRRLDDSPARWRRRGLAGAAVVGALLALAVAWGDYRLADSARSAARAVAARPRGPGSILWFQGHWGFQYYLQEAGGRPLDRRVSRVGPGDVVVIPANNTNLFPIPREAVQGWEVLEFPVAGPAATMSGPAGAGYYSDVWGPLPFALGPAPPERYLVYAIGAGFGPR